MENLDIRIHGNTLTIKVDLSRTVGVSGGGQNMTIASSRGNLRLPSKKYGIRPETLNINVWRPKTEDEMEADKENSPGGPFPRGEM